MLRSRISNRPGGLAGVDGRSGPARRFRDLTSGLKRDIGRVLSAAEESLVDQAAALMLQREAMTAVGACGGSIDLRELVRVSGAVARTLAALGLAPRLARSTADRKSKGHTQNSETANDSADSLSTSEIANKIADLFEQAKYTRNPEVLARAARVREMLEVSCTRFRRHRVRCFMEQEVRHGEKAVYAGVQA
jgi:hypothetical protein